MAKISSWSIRGANSLLSPDEVETAGLPAAGALIAQLETPLPTALLGVAGVLVPNLAELARPARGALVVCRSAAKSVRIAALPVAAVDTTGARDCLCGTLAACLADGLRRSRVVTTAR